MEKTKIICGLTLLLFLLVGLWILANQFGTCNTIPPKDTTQDKGGELYPPKTEDSGGGIIHVETVLRNENTENDIKEKYCDEEDIKYFLIVEDGLEDSTYGKVALCECLLEGEDKSIDDCTKLRLPQLGFHN